MVAAIGRIIHLATIFEIDGERCRFDGESIAVLKSNNKSIDAEAAKFISDIAMSSNTHFEKVRANPAHYYSSPLDLVEDDSLTCEQKISILKFWESEAIHIQESEAEGFQGGETSKLDTIKQAIDLLEPISK